MIQRWRSFNTADELIAPPLYRAECTSAFARLVQTGRINETNGRLGVEKTLSLPVRIIEQPALYPRAFDIARALG